MDSFDPLNIPKDDFPLVVFSDDSIGLFSFLIRWRTRGMYNHAMMATKPGVLASQSVTTYSEIPMEDYIKKGRRLKFIGIRGLSYKDRMNVFMSIQNKLEKSKLKKRYDFLGIVGQAVGLSWINNPWTQFCSEDVVSHLRAALPCSDPCVSAAIADLPKHGSPEDVNAAMKRHKDVFYVVGRWTYD